MTTTTKISLTVAAIMKILIAFILKRNPTFLHNTEIICISRDLNSWLKMELFTLSMSCFPYMILGTNYPGF